MRVGAGECFRDVRHEQVRNDACEPRSWPEHRPVRLVDGLDRLRAAGRIGRLQTYADDLPRRRRHRDLTAHLDRRARILRQQADHLGDDLQRSRRKRQHTSGGAEHAPGDGERVHRVAQQLEERGEHEVADGVPLQLPGAVEAVLVGPRPQLLVRARTGEGSQRHPQVARGQRAELPA